MVSSDTQMTPHSALLLIDIQQGFDHPTYWGTERSTPKFEENIGKLLSAFRSTPGALVLHVRHHSTFPACPLHPSQPGVEFMQYASPLPSERVFIKSTNSAFIGTDLADTLRTLNLEKLVIAGLTTGHCVSTTVRMASNMHVVDHHYGGPRDGNSSNSRIILVEDATATFDIQRGEDRYGAETLHAVHLATLANEFCDIESTNQILSNLGPAI